MIYLDQAANNVWSLTNGLTYIDTVLKYGPNDANFNQIHRLVDFKLTIIN